MLLITKFNKMIRNKILWGIFAVLISIAFTFYLGGSMGGCDDSEAKAGAVGEVFGEGVTPSEFARARFYATGLQPAYGLSEEQNEMLRQMTWKRLAAIEKARRLGITVSDGELRETIRRDPAFAVNGVFSKARYRSFLRDRIQMDPATFEDYLRQELVIQKLNQTAEAMTWTAPSELARQLRMFSDNFTVKYALLPVDEFKSQIKVSEQDAREFYDENIELFREPDLMSVRYVKFAASDYTSGVSVTEGEIAEYYDVNAAEFTSYDGTNDTPVVAPYENVRDSIASILKRNYALYAARDAATELVMDMIPDRYGNSVSFEDAAAAMDVSLNTSALFSAEAPVEFLDVGLDFNRTAFELASDASDTTFSEAILGESNAYVITPARKVESRIPSFEEVREEAIGLATEEAKRLAFAKKTEEVRKSIEDQLAKDRSFEEAVEEFDINASTSLTFNAYEAIPDSAEYMDAILPVAISMEKGETSEPVDVPEGALIVYVADRTPGDTASMQLLRSQLLSTLDRYRAGLVFEGWKDYNLKAAELVDRKKLADANPAETEE